jgi:hypothetical protein
MLALPYSTGPMSQPECAHEREASLVSAAAEANAAIVWPEGKEE